MTVTVTECLLLFSVLKNILKKCTCPKLSVITGPGSGVMQTVSIVVLLRTSRNVPVLTTALKFWSNTDNFHLEVSSTLFNAL